MKVIYYLLFFVWFAVFIFRKLIHNLISRYKKFDADKSVFFMYILFATIFNIKMFH